jgi:hypothetical protein
MLGGKGFLEELKQTRPALNCFDVTLTLCHKLVTLVTVVEVPVPVC